MSLLHHWKCDDAADPTVLADARAREALTVVGSLPLVAGAIGTARAFASGSYAKSTEPGADEALGLGEWLLSFRVRRAVDAPDEQQTVLALAAEGTSDLLDCLLHVYLEADGEDYLLGISWTTEEAPVEVTPYRLLVPKDAAFHTVAICRRLQSDGLFAVDAFLDGAPVAPATASDANDRGTTDLPAPVAGLPCLVWLGAVDGQAPLTADLDDFRVYDDRGSKGLVAAIHNQSPSEEDLEDAIREWILESTGLPESSVLLSEQDNGEGQGDFVTFELVGHRLRGARAEATHHFSAARGALYDIELRSTQLAEMTVQLQAVSAKGQGSSSAAALLKACQRGLGVARIRRLLNVAGISVFDSGVVQQLNRVVTTDYEGRAVLDVQCYVRSSASDFLGYIATISGAIEVDGTSKPFEAPSS